MNVEGFEKTVRALSEAIIAKAASSCLGCLFRIVLTNDRDPLESYEFFVMAKSPTEAADAVGKALDAAADSFELNESCVLSVCETPCLQHWRYEPPQTKREQPAGKTPAEEAPQQEEAKESPDAEDEEPEPAQPAGV